VLSRWYMLLECYLREDVPAGRADKGGLGVGGMKVESRNAGRDSGSTTSR
jgi:hypothetical protein